MGLIKTRVKERPGPLLQEYLIFCLFYSPLQDFWKVRLLFYDEVTHHAASFDALFACVFSVCKCFFNRNTKKDIFCIGGKNITRPLVCPLNLPLAPLKL